MVVTPGFEPGSRPYEWNEVDAVCTLTRVAFYACYHYTKSPYRNILWPLNVRCAHPVTKLCLDFEYVFIWRTVGVSIPLPRQ
jgi:hypothetical protein